VQRTYLYVPPEDKVEVQALGAQWDGDSKRWYIGSDQNAARFASWLPRATQAEAPDDEPHEDEPFTIVSSQACVASTTTACQRCNSNIEVVCIHCESGTVSGEPLTRFTVAHIWALEEELARQLRRWPNFRRVIESDDEAFANHCPHCGAQQDDMYLHSEPDEPFFVISSAAPGSIRLTPLTGTVRLSGDKHFHVD
jgi:Domain of unknown function (DUF5710)